MWPSALPQRAMHFVVTDQSGPRTGSSRILLALLVAISMSAAAPSSTAAASAASPAAQGSRMQSLSEQGLAILLRMGCSARIKTHHGRYIACGDIVGAMAEATAQDFAEAATFWVQEVAKERPQECVFAVGLHAPVKAGGVASFLKITGNGDEGLAMCTTKDQTSAPIRLAWANNNGPYVGLQETQGASKRYLCAHKSGKFGLKDHARNFERYEMSIYSASTKATPGKKPDMAPAQPSTSPPSSGDGDWIGLWDACVSATASLGVDVSLKSRNARDQDVTLKSGGTLVVGGESRPGIKLAAASEFGKLCLVDASTGKFLLVDKHGKITEQDKPCGGGDVFEAHVDAEAVNSAMEKRALARSSVLWPASAPAKPSGKGKGGKGAVAPCAGTGNDAADDVASNMKKMSLKSAEEGNGGKGGGKGNKKGGKKGAGQKEGGKGKRLTYDQKVKQATENFVVKGKNKGNKGGKGAVAAPVPTSPAAKEKKENPLSKLPDPKDAAHSGNDGSKPESASPSTGGGGMSSTLGSSSSSAVTCDGCRIALSSVKMAGGQVSPSNSRAMPFPVSMRVDVRGMCIYVHFVVQIEQREAIVELPSAVAHDDDDDDDDDVDHVLGV